MIKRAIDLIASLIILFVLSPLLVLIVVLVRLYLGSPVLFRQTRIGYMERPFTLVKFRTMRDAWDINGNLLPDQERVTPFGTFLRKTSLDELPQLWNVVRGEMSLIGPRPLFVRYFPYYTERERIRHNVRPGITGLAQVMGRNTLLWDDRLELDVQYVERQSLALDFWILVRTIIKVFKRENVFVVPGLQQPPLDIARSQVAS